MYRCIAVVSAFLMIFACQTQAETMTWGSGDLSAFGGLANNYIVRLYEDVGVNNDFGVSDALDFDDAWTGDETVLVVGKAGTTYGSSFIWPGGSLAQGDDVFTVIFNATTIGAATQYVIVDSATFDLPDPLGGPGNYVLTSVSGTWQAIPEPTTLALLGIGIGTAAAARRRRRRREADVA